MEIEEGKAAADKQAGSSDIAERIVTLSPERLRLLAREVKKKKGGFVVPRNSMGVDACLVPIRKQGPRPPLFLVHPVGGGIVAYHDLSQYLSPQQPVYALQNHTVQSGEDQEEEMLNVQQMASRYVAVVQSVWPQGPYMLGGASMGGAVAFEMAVQLEAHGREVPLVAMLDTPARVIPHMHGYESHSPLAVELTLLAGIIASGQARDFGMPVAELDAMSPEEQVHHVFSQLQEQKLISASLDISAFQAALLTFKKNLNALEAYVPGMFGGRIVNLRATEVSAYMREKAAELCDDPTFGWQSHCRQPVSVCFVPGDHVRMNLEPHVQTVGAELQRYLNEVCGGRV